jgi:hypothetical protein
VQNIEEGGDKFGFMSKFRKGLRVAGGKEHKEGKGSIKNFIWTISTGFEEYIPSTSIKIRCFCTAVEFGVA